MSHATAVLIAVVAANAGLLALVLLRGARTWLQVTYAACGLSFVVAIVGSLGIEERLVPPERGDLVLGPLLLAYALTAILVLGLIHGETLPRRRGSAFLLLVPVPLLAALAPSQGWTAESAYGNNAVMGFLALCLAIALAEAVYARMSSRILVAQSFWLSLGIVALIVGGPLYAFETESLGLPFPAGANFGSPIALAAFALVAFQGDPFRVAGRTSGTRWSGTSPLPEGAATLFEEARPTYAIRAARKEAARGRPTLVVARSVPETTGGVSVAELRPSRHASLKLLTTASEFLSAHPRGLVVVPDFADVFAMDGSARACESAARLRHAARNTRGTVLLSTARLLPPERHALAELHLLSWTLPDPVREIEAILGKSFGSGGARLLDAFCLAHGVRRQDVTTDHVSALVEFLERTVSALSGAADRAAGHGLITQLEAAASVLRSFASQDPSDLARGRWPSRSSARTEEEILVMATDHWKGAGTEELLAAANARAEREPLFERTRAVFVDQLGDAGEGVLRSELARLGKEPGQLEKADLRRLADRTAVHLATLAEVVDLAAEKDRLRRQIESIRHRLERLVEEDA